jgi:hypothetical protein
MECGQRLHKEAGDIKPSIRLDALGVILGHRCIQCTIPLVASRIALTTCQRVVAPVSGIQKANDECSYFGSTFTARANRSAAARALQPRVDPDGAASPEVIMAVIRSDTTSWRLMWQVNVP